MNDSTKEAGIPKGKPELIRIDEGEIRNHLDQIVRGTVEETLNALLEAEAIVVPNFRTGFECDMGSDLDFDRMCTRILTVKIKV
jgi:hypothetical protein